MTPGVADSGFILRSTFGATGTLGLHGVGYTLGLYLQLYWSALELPVEDRTGIGTIHRWLFVMWMYELSYLVDHAVLLLVLIGWLAHLLEFCDGFCGWSCNQWPPQILLFSWRGICCKYLQVWKSLLFFGFTEFGVLWFLQTWMAGSRRVLDRIFRLCWYCFLQLRMAGSRWGLARIGRACFLFWFIA